ncbi:hypothetical protein Brsp01_33980 [Brucella sp. NBRC 12950]|nr:hypothetical protein Brsp01_33980 [Brucella sp. NBRC 12950]
MLERKTNRICALNGIISASNITHAGTFKAIAPKAIAPAKKLRKQIVNAVCPIEKPRSSSR